MVGVTTAFLEQLYSALSGAKRELIAEGLEHHLTMEIRSAAPATHQATEVATLRAVRAVAWLASWMPPPASGRLDPATLEATAKRLFSKIVAAQEFRDALTRHFPDVDTDLRPMLEDAGIPPGSIRLGVSADNAWRSVIRHLDGNSPLLGIGLMEEANRRKQAVLEFHPAHWISDSV